MVSENRLSKSVLVAGGGMSGLTAAVEAAEAGCQVYIVEKQPYLGGRVAQMNKYFPKLCPPNCGLEINFKRIKQNPAIRAYTLAEVEEITGGPGDYSVSIRLKPRYVNENCTACGNCAGICPAERLNDFNIGMDKTKAVYLPHEFAFPMKYVIDMEACLGEKCGRCLEACEYGAIDLDMKEKVVNLRVGAVIWATGWKPYDAARIDYYGFGRYPNVITNLMMERLAAPNGPTKGKILRPSDGKEVESAAFIQCAGSRDENHLAYCSQVCCLASLKQATYIREKNPKAKVYIFYIDIRALGKFEDFYSKVSQDSGIELIKGKAGEIKEDPETKQLVVQAEDQAAGRIRREKVDLVVLAAGMVPSTAEGALPSCISCTEDGFLTGRQESGIIGAGCIKKPLDVASSVQSATAAALKAIQTMVRR